MTNHTILTVLCLSAILALGACGGSRDLSPTDLDVEGAALRIDAPAGATVEEASLGGTAVRAEDFEVIVRAGSVDIASERADAEANENQEIVSGDDTSLIVGQQFLGRTVYSVYANVDVGGTSYRCETDPLSTFDDDDDAEAMLAACRSLSAR